MNPDVIILADTIHTMEDRTPGSPAPQAVAVQDGVVYYNVGSATNSDPVDRTSDPERGIVARVGLGVALRLGRLDD